MKLLINKIISNILQIALFALIPFVWWFITARKQQKFTQWIWLKKVKGGKKTLVIIVSTTFMLSAFLTFGVV